MKFSNFIKKLSIYLLATLFISYGIAAMILNSNNLSLKDIFYNNRNNLKSLVRIPNDNGDFSFDNLDDKDFSFGDLMYKHSYDVNDTKTSNLDGIDTINLDFVSEDIKIETYKESEFKISATGKIQSSEAISKKELELSKDGSILNVTLSKNSFMNIHSYSSNINVTVYVPETYHNNLKIKTTSSDLNLSHMNVKALNISTVSGDCTLDNISTDKLDLHTTSGNIESKNITSKENLVKTTSGDIKLIDIMGSLKLNTTSGDSSITYTNLDGNLELTSVSGDIHISVPKDSNFKLNARTTSGDLNVGVKNANVSKEKHSLSATLGNGKNTININTVSGDISVN